MSFTPEPLPPLPMTLAQAIARMEGWYSAGQVPNRPQRNFNPGDVEYGPFAQEHGAIGTDGRFAIFPDSNTGFACLECLLAGPDYATLTIEDGVNKYAPPVENNTALYVSAVCFWTKLEPTQIIGEVLS